MSNPLLNDADVDFVLHDVLDVSALTALPYFADHSRDTFDAILDAGRRVAREVLWPGYEELDKNPPEFVDGRIVANKALVPMLKHLNAMGITAAHRPYDVGGQQVPLAVKAAADAYLMAGNLSASVYPGLTAGAGHLIEAFGTDEVKAMFLDQMYSGEWTGTMALTEPQAGSSLGDLTTSATPADDGSYRISGSKIFISGGDHDLVDNIVHLVLARIDGAPRGTKGISLFAVPKRRPAADGGGDGDGFVDNDVAVTGMIHKIGWRGAPSLALQFGERGDCHGWLVGEEHRGLAHMFQMMNEARLMVGLNGAATASVGYQESLAYARERTQGRVPGAPSADQVALTSHADVRRMLLRQKAIVDGALTLIFWCSLQADLAEHAEDPEVREQAATLLNLLTPVAKTFPAEYGFEANALAVQIHGGYGYSSEYLPEAFLRDQKLNSIHEGTTGIQGIDLLGRRAMAGGGAALAVLMGQIGEAVEAAEQTDLDPSMALALQEAADLLAAVTAEQGALGAAGEADRMLRHSTDYLMAFSVVVVAWQHLRRATVATRLLGSDEGAGGREAHLRGVIGTCEYWLATELPVARVTLERVRSGEESYASFDPAGF